MDPEWFFRQGHEILGPVSIDVLMRLAEQGQIDARTQVWREDLPKWIQAAQVPQLAAALSLGNRVNTRVSNAEGCLEAQAARNESLLVAWIVGVGVAMSLIAFGSLVIYLFAARPAQPRVAVAPVEATEGPQADASGVGKEGSEPKSSQGPGSPTQKRVAIRAGSHANPPLPPAMEPEIPNRAGLTAGQTPPAEPRQGGTDLADLVARVKPAIVRIEVDIDRPGNGGALGSGVVIDAEAGIVATNLHVVEGGRQAKVVFHDGGSAAVLGFVNFSSECDLCLLKIDPGHRTLLALPVADALPRQGVSVVAVGNPKGLPFVATQGIVSGVTTSEQLRSLGFMTNPGDAEWLQHDAAINPGNSGGPLLSLGDGVVQGLNTFRFAALQGIYFSNTGPAIRAGLAARSPVAPLTDLPSDSPSLNLPTLPSDVLAEISQENSEARFNETLKHLPEYRRKAVLQPRLIASSDADRWSSRLALIETGAYSLVDALRDREFLVIGGVDFFLYLQLIYKVDHAIETHDDPEHLAETLLKLVANSSDEETQAVVASMLHRMHVRQHSLKTVPALLRFLADHVDAMSYRTGRREYDAMLAWYADRFQVSVGREMRSLGEDIIAYEKRLQSRIGAATTSRGRQSRNQRMAAAREEVRVYATKLADILKENGLKNWIFKATPLEDGQIELSRWAGRLKIRLQLDLELDAPCEVVLNAQYVPRRRWVRHALRNDTLWITFEIDQNELQNLELMRVLQLKTSPVRQAQILGVPLDLPDPDDDDSPDAKFQQSLEFLSPSAP